MPMRCSPLRVAAALAVALAGCQDPPETTLTAAGTIEATDANVAARTGGALLAVGPREGEPVDSAQVIACLDSAELGWQRQQAEAGRDLARADLELALNGPRREDLDQAAAAVDQARVQRDAAALDRTRAEELAAAGSAPAKQLDDAVARHRVAGAALAMT
ncbi:MAG: secretion protein HlyD, partial [Gemmatimonadota bacterium]